MQHPIDRSTGSFAPISIPSKLAPKLALTLALAVSLALPTPCPADAPKHGGGDHATSHRSFADVDKWSKVFDDPERDAWQKPAALVDSLALHPGMTVAEIGAGTGYLMRFLVAAVGETGSVLLADVEPELIAHLRTRAEELGADNVVPILASKHAPRLPLGSVDLVLFLDTYHHIHGRVAYMKSLQRHLRAGGRVAVVDWIKEELPKGPPLDHKIDRHQVIAEMQSAGYAFAGTPLELPYHYVLLFAPETGK